MTLYEILGIPADADDKVIRAAYRRKASLHHPDRSGGNLQEMQKVQEAYDVLSDAERRQQYDKTGSAERESPIETKAAGMLAQLFGAVLDTMLVKDDAPEFTQVPDLVRASLTESLTEGKEYQRGMTQRIAIRRAVRSRLVFAEGCGTDYADAALAHQIAEMEKAMRTAESGLAIVRAALTMLANYGYRCDERPKSGQLSWEQVFASQKGA